MTAVTDRPASVVERLGGRLSRGEWTALVLMGLFILLLHVLGWGTLLFAIVPQDLQIGTNEVFGVGLGVTAYTLGMRHAFDADHIAAIDNVTRKLMGEGKRPVSVGFWFSLGHSSVVFGLCVLLALGVKALASQVGDESSTLQTVTGLIGTAVSGTFLVALGLINLVALVGIAKVFRRMRHGHYDEAELEAHLERRGLMNRILAPIIRTIRKPWQMYPTGLLFGLGFDTATEVSLLVLAGGVAAFTLPWYAILVLPVLFAAGMSLFDTIDGCFMNFAYGWAFSRPVRKVFYNLTITALSVVVALGIGGIELISILADRLDVESGPLAALGGIDLEYVGYVIVGGFVVAWALAVLYWRLGRVEERWTAKLASGPGPDDVETLSQA